MTVMRTKRALQLCLTVLSQNQDVKDQIMFIIQLMNISLLCNSKSSKKDKVKIFEQQLRSFIQTFYHITSNAPGKDNNSLFAETDKKVALFPDQYLINLYHSYCKNNGLTTINKLVIHFSKIWSQAQEITDAILPDKKIKKSKGEELDPEKTENCPKIARSTPNKYKDLYDFEKKYDSKSFDDEEEEEEEEEEEDAAKKQTNPKKGQDAILDAQREKKFQELEKKFDAYLPTFPSAPSSSNVHFSNLCRTLLRTVNKENFFELSDDTTDKSIPRLNSFLREELKLTHPSNHQEEDIQIAQYLHIILEFFHNFDKSVARTKIFTINSSRKWISEFEKVFSVPGDILTKDSKIHSVIGQVVEYKLRDASLTNFNGELASQGLIDESVYCNGNVTEMLKMDFDRVAYNPQKPAILPKIQIPQEFFCENNEDRRFLWNELLDDFMGGRESQFGAKYFSLSEEKKKTIHLILTNPDEKLMSTYLDKIKETMKAQKKQKNNKEKAQEETPIDDSFTEEEKLITHLECTTDKSLKGKLSNFECLKVILLFLRKNLNQSLVDNEFLHSNDPSALKQLTHIFKQCITEIGGMGIHLAIPVAIILSTVQIFDQYFDSTTISPEISIATNNYN